MVVVLGEAFGEFVPGELVVGDDSGDDPGLFEHDQVAVDARLGEPVPGLENLRDRDRLSERFQDCHEGASPLGVALIRLPQQGGDLIVEFVIGHG